MLPDPSTDGGPDGARPATIFLRPLGTPMPIGLVGVTVAVTVLSCLQLGWIPSSQQHQAALALIAFAFPLQALATVLLFLARDAPVGASFGVMSFSWLTLGLMLILSRPGSTSAAAAVFLFAAGATMLPGVASTAISKLVPATIFLMASAKLVLTGVYEKLGGTAWAHAAGWEGVILAAVALYGALASDLEGEMHRTVLPLGRLGVGRRAVDPDREPLDREPGVRPQV